MANSGFLGRAARGTPPAWVIVAAAMVSGWAGSGGDSGDGNGNKPTSRAFPIPFLAPAAALAQAPDVTIESRANLNRSPEVLASAEALRGSEGGALLDMDGVAAALAEPTPQPVSLPGLRTEVLPAPEVATLAADALVRVGWYWQKDGSPPTKS